MHTLPALVYCEVSIPLAGKAAVGKTGRRKPEDRSQEAEGKTENAKPLTTEDTEDHGGLTAEEKPFRHRFARMSADFPNQHSALRFSLMSLTLYSAVADRGQECRPSGARFVVPQTNIQNPKVSDISIQPAQQIRAVSTGIVPSKVAKSKRRQKKQVRSWDSTKNGKPKNLLPQRTLRTTEEEEEEDKSRKGKPKTEKPNPYRMVPALRLVLGVG
jgi:hypothetical protein